MTRCNQVRKTKKDRGGNRKTVPSFSSRKERNYFTKECDENNILDFNFYKSKKIETSQLIKPRTLNQKRYVDSIKQNSLTIAEGMPGSGKTLFPTFLGIQFINNDNHPIDKLIYIRANTESQYENQLGFTKGDILEKVAPLARPLLRNLMEFMPMQNAINLVATKNDKLEILTLTHLIGETFNNAMIIADEMEFYSPGAIKLILSRMGENSKLVFCGDDQQADKKNTNIVNRTIKCWENKLEDFGYVRFENDDCQRHSIIAPAIKLLNNL